MPYPQLEELTSRKREKVALFLTAENMAGLLAVGLPAYIGTLHTTFWLRSLILLAAAVLGVLLTTDVNGMACYERALWWMRGRLRRQVTGRVIRPAEFLAAPVMEGDRAVPVGGPVRRAKRRMTNLSPQLHLHGVTRTAVAPYGRDLHRVTARTSRSTPVGTAAAGGVADGDQEHG